MTEVGLVQRGVIDMDIKINKPKWDSEGLDEMIFTAGHLNTIYECCKGDCDSCILNKPIPDTLTTFCLLISSTKVRLIDTIKSQL